MGWKFGLTFWDGSYKINHMVNSTMNLDRTFSALSDPSRRMMLRRLAHGPATAGELGAPLTMSAPAVSKHLRVLEEAGLIDRQRRGRAQWCRIRPRPLLVALSWIEQQKGIWEGLLDSLEAYLESTQHEAENNDGDDASRT